MKKIKKLKKHKKSLCDDYKNQFICLDIKRGYSLEIPVFFVIVVVLTLLLLLFVVTVIIFYFNYLFLSEMEESLKLAHCELEQYEGALLNLKEKTDYINTKSEVWTVKFRQFLAREFLNTFTWLKESRIRGKYYGYW